MRLNQGKIGYAEAISVCALSLFVNGVFAVDARSAYIEGNSTYLALPLAVMLSLLIAVFALNAMERLGAGSLTALFRNALGGGLGAVMSVLLSLALIFASAKPLSEFVNVLHRLVYDGVSHWTILLFVMPVTVLIAWKGFESIGRLALVFVGLMLASVAVAVISASPEFEISRLYPLLGTGSRSFISLTLSEELYLLPPFCALLVNARGAGGISSVRRILIISGVAAAVLICGVQLALGLIYPYSVLSGLLMPLYRINFLSLSQSYLLRLDKLFIIIWLNGCIISCAYLIYSASLLLTEAFRSRDVTPAVMTLSFAVCASTALGAEQEMGAAQKLYESGRSFGWLFAFVPLLLASAAAVFMRRKEKE